jgi:hypothetical protein
LFGGANGQGGRNADSEASFEWNLNYSFSGAAIMDITATFVTANQGTTTATLAIPFKPASPQPPTIGPKLGVVRQFSSLKDPNGPVAFKFKLESFSVVQLNTLRHFVETRLNDPTSAALLPAIDRELKRRKVQRKKEEEDGKRKVNLAAC